MLYICYLENLREWGIEGSPVNYIFWKEKRSNLNTLPSQDHRTWDWLLGEMSAIDLRSLIEKRQKQTNWRGE